MSENKVPHPGDIYSRAGENLIELKDRFPSQFPAGMITSDWPNGWHPLMAEACAFVAENHPTIRWLQIKEKFASLRMYYSGGPIRMDLHSDRGLQSLTFESGNATRTPELEERLIQIERASMTTCCACGAQGAERRVFSRWHLVSCEQCAPKIADFKLLETAEYRDHANDRKLEAEGLDSLAAKVSSRISERALIPGLGVVACRTFLGSWFYFAADEVSSESGGPALLSELLLPVGMPIGVFASKADSSATDATTFIVALREEIDEALSSTQVVDISHTLRIFRSGEAYFASRPYPPPLPRSAS